MAFDIQEELISGVAGHGENSPEEASKPGQVWASSVCIGSWVAGVWLGTGGIFPGPGGFSSGTCGMLFLSGLCLVNIADKNWCSSLYDMKY